MVCMTTLHQTAILLCHKVTRLFCHDSWLHESHPSSIGSMCMQHCALLKYACTSRCSLSCPKYQHLHRGQQKKQKFLGNTLFQMTWKLLCLTYEWTLCEDWIKLQRWAKKIVRGCETFIPALLPVQAGPAWVLLSKIYILSSRYLCRDRQKGSS